MEFLKLFYSEEEVDNTYLNEAKLEIKKCCSSQSEYVNEALGSTIIASTHRKYSPEEKAKLVEGLFNGFHGSIRMYAKQVGIDESNIRLWIKQYHNHIPFRSSGRLRYIDDIGMKETNDRLEADAVAHINNGGFKTVFCQMAYQTGIRQKAKQPGFRFLASRNTISHYKKACKVHDVKPDWTIDARDISVADKRMAITWMAMCHTFITTLPAERKFNCDATTIEVKDSGYEFISVPNSHKGKVVVTGANALAPSIFIKWMALGNAAGHAAPLCLIIELPELPRDVVFS